MKNPINGSRNLLSLTPAERIPWGVATCCRFLLFKSGISAVFTRHCVASGKRSRRPGRVSGTLLLEAYVLSLCDKAGQADQVVGGAAEDEQPVHLFQST